MLPIGPRSRDLGNPREELVSFDKTGSDSVTRELPVAVASCDALGEDEIASAFAGSFNGYTSASAEKSIVCGGSGKLPRMA